MTLFQVADLLQFTQKYVLTRYDWTYLMEAYLDGELALEVPSD